MTGTEVLKTGKQVARFLVSVGAGAIVSGIVTCTQPINGGIFKKLCVGAASFAASSMAADRLADYADEKIDGMIDAITVAKVIM